VVLDNASFDHPINVTGDIHIILKDNAVMNVGTESSPVSGNGIGDAGLNNFSTYKPYLLKAKSSGTLLSATNVTVSASPAEGTMHRLWGAGPVNTGNAYLYGTMRYMGTEAPAAGGLYIMQSSGNWGLVETPQDYNPADGSGVCILPMRAYVKMGSPAAARRLTATYTSGIEEIASGEDLNTPVYNLQGMKVNPANAKGIVIIGGKKVVR